MPRPTDTILKYARLGAAIRLKQLDDERRAINRAFPGLHWQKSNGSAPASASVKARSWNLNAAQRKAISERMKKTWAARRAAKGKS